MLPSRLTSPPPAEPSAEAEGARLSLGVASDERAWDEFVAGRADASAYHRAGWATAIGAAFGHEVRMLSVVGGGEMHGVLPLVLMRSRLFGRFVVSLPFLNAGGVLSRSEAATRVLVEAAVDIARAEGAKYLELRHTRRLCPSYPARTHKVGMSLSLKSSVEEQWQALDRKVRNQVRKGEKNGLTCEIGGLGLVGEFYSVFSRNMRDLGTPVFPVRLFEAALRAFPAETDVFCVRHAGRPVAGAVMHRYGSWSEVIWASSLREFNPMSANVFLYWQMIQRAIGKGVRTFEFGRCTPGEGTFHFKQQWGAEPLPLVWEYWTPTGTIDADASPKNPRYARAIAVWRHLPLAVTNAVGPRLVRGIPC